MRKLIIAAAAVLSGAAIAAPASAQQYDNYYQGNGYYQNNGYNQPYGYDQGYNTDNRYNRGADPRRWADQLSQIRNDVAALSRDGRLTRRETEAMQRNLYVVDRALRKYSERGIGQREAWDMDRRVNALRVSLRRSANDADTRYNDGGYRR